MKFSSVFATLLLYCWSSPLVWYRTTSLSLFIPLMGWEERNKHVVGAWSCPAARVIEESQRLMCGIIPGRLFVGTFAPKVLCSRPFDELFNSR